MARRKKKLADPRSAAGGNRQPVEDSGFDRAYDDMMSEFDDGTGVNARSLRKARKYLILSVSPVIAAIASFVLLTAYNNGVLGNEYTGCWTHEQKVEALATKYVEENAFASYPTYVEDIPSFKGLSAYRCPKNGTYTWNPITGEYTCSEHGHYDPEFNKATTDSTGQSSRVINND